MTAPVIEIRNAVKVYGEGEQQLRVLDNVSLDIHKGEFVAIMGASGSGKSTLLQIMGLLDRMSSGEYRLFGKDTTHLNENELANLRSGEIGFVFQQFHLLSRTAAIENVALPCMYSGAADGIERSRLLLERVGLRDRLHHRPNELSGGQQQRVAIARALVNNPGLILADEPTGNLDSQSKKEIMELLTELHEEGLTVVMVTHESDIARYCDRIITLRDGRIIKDSAGGKPAVKSPPAAPHRTNSTGHNPGDRIYSYIKAALKTLFANKGRTALSALGILFGVAAVIAVMAIGQGARESIREQLSSMGSNLLVIRPGAIRTGGVTLESGAVTRLRASDGRTLQARIPEISKVSSTVNGRVQTVFGNKNWNTFLTGAETDYREIRSLTPKSGRYFTQAEDSSRALVALIGETVRRELFGTASPLGQYIRLNRVHFKIIGILPERGANAFRDQDDMIVMPLQTAMRRVLSKDFVDGIEVEIADADSIEPAMEKIRVELNRLHSLPLNRTDSFRIQNMADIQAAVSQTSETLSALLISIAAVSLLVGGIGIMNIMLVSVKERTREIGLRKAIGARPGDIMSQFLIEAILISLLGGGAGLLTGVGLSFGIAGIMGWVTIVSPISVILSLGFSSVTGILFGLWPARMAARMNAISALRYE